MKNLFRYLASTNGRTVRFISGAVIVSAGLFVSPILIIIGLLPLLAAVFDVCIFAPLFKLPFKGDKLRDSLSK